MQKITLSKKIRTIIAKRMHTILLAYCVGCIVYHPLWQPGKVVGGHVGVCKWHKHPVKLLQADLCNNIITVITVKPLSGDAHRLPFTRQRAFLYPAFTVWISAP